MKTLREILENENYDFDVTDEFSEFVDMIDFLDATNSFEEWIVKCGEKLGIEKEKINERLGEGFDSDVAKNLKNLYNELIGWRNKK